MDGFTCIDQASALDADAIAALVNQAYRPEGHTHGWTHEAALVSGLRISPAQVRALFRAGSSILVMRGKQGLLACVHIEQAGLACYIGMLATLPSSQNQGLGKTMLQAAEVLATQQYGAHVLKMLVLSSRPELQAYYERRGYALTGHCEPYPLYAGVGVPQREDLIVMEMSKPV
ncbi:GNAT family N-acetyltransferase [Methylobacillus methanolivorans]|uniref:GNAT family N-acetyltransferase n=1 Tax=Methylobacillus methanolivorans TaxID=1848927 RepID=A0ABW8GHN6_9PROT